MKRFAEQNLYEWLTKPNRKPLIIRGARQVGKSTLVRNFAAWQNLNLYEINLEKYPQLNSVFKTLNVDKIIKEISGILGKEIVPDNGLLFLDEIQEVPEAIRVLRYFYEEKPELAVVSAGSLLEFALAKHNFSMPVGRIEYCFLGPMTFEEFLLAKKETYYLDCIKQFNFNQDFEQSVHEKLLELQREFLLVGGMPEAIKVYLETNKLSEVFDVQNSILLTYQDDFSKYARNKELLRLHKVFNYIPRAIGKKVKYSNIIKEDQSRDIKAAIGLLTQAGVISKIMHSDSSGVPLSAFIDETVYKMLFLDIGLVNRMCGLDWRSISSLDDRMLVNEGSIAEQFIGQNLLYFKGIKEHPVIYYWLREKKISNAEVDYIVFVGNLVIPIEVKSGKSGTLKSLIQFIGNKKIDMGVRIDLNLPSMHQVKHEGVSFNLVSLPMYFIGQLERILSLLL